jgi:peroxiredoxin family protein
MAAAKAAGARGSPVTNAQVEVEAEGPTPERPNGVSIVLFSGELDKALAAFTIANGAAAMDLPVTMFFTFWGINVLRRDGPVTLSSKKTTMESMFGSMMPRGPNKLKLSKMNMGGLGTRLIKGEMVKKHVSPLPKMIQDAQEQGVKMLACRMSMDLMGLKREELLPDLPIVNVGQYIDTADRCRITLFI